MRYTLSLLATLASIGAAKAQTPFSFPSSLVVVTSGQMSRVGATTSLDINCHFNGYPQIEVINPPANGRVFFKHLPSAYPTYPTSSDRFRCDNMKRPAVEILYQSSSGFTGSDSFRIEIIDMNHSANLKPYQVQVQ